MTDHMEEARKLYAAIEYADSCEIIHAIAAAEQRGRDTERSEIIKWHETQARHSFINDQNEQALFHSYAAEDIRGAKP
jgi:hypothetical protein